MRSTTIDADALSATCALAPPIDLLVVVSLKAHRSDHIGTALPKSRAEACRRRHSAD